MTLDNGVFRFLLFSLSHTISFLIPIQGDLSSACDQWKCGTRKNNRAIFYNFLLIWQNTYLLKAKWLWNVLNATLCYVEVCASRAYGVYYPNKISLNHILNTPLKVLARVMFLMCHDLWWCAPSLPFFSHPLHPLRFARSPRSPNQISIFDSQCGVGGFGSFFSIHSMADTIADLARSPICSGLYSFVYVAELIWICLCVCFSVLAFSITPAYKFLYVHKRCPSICYSIAIQTHCLFCALGKLNKQSPAIYVFSFHRLVGCRNKKKNTNGNRYEKAHRRESRSKRRSREH